MISVARQVNLTASEAATQATAQSPVFEVLTSHFASRLLKELQRGASHSYVHNEGNVSVLRGRIRFPDHIRTNSARHDRLYVEFDDFAIDTPLNRILKSTCELLVQHARSSGTVQMIREILIELADVERQRLEYHHFERLIVDRNAARFAPFVAFCRLIFEGLTTTSSHGSVTTFGFLVAMNDLFEDFVGRVLVSKAKELGIDRRAVHLQAKNRRRWLLERQGGQHAILLKPDIVIDGVSGDHPFAIVDTKWKSQAGSGGLGVPISDIYQMIAYGKRYHSERNILLLPSIGKLAPQTYKIPGDSEGSSIRVAYVDLSVNLAMNPRSLEDDLRLAIGLPLPEALPTP
jgi:5-methylcytosine-specific restriction enzyme subunit McrC